MTTPDNAIEQLKLSAIEEGKWVYFNPESLSVNDALNSNLPIQQKERIKDLPEGTKLMLIRQDLICTVDSEFGDMGEILAGVVTLKHLSAEDSKSTIDLLSGEEIAHAALTGLFK